MTPVTTAIPANVRGAAEQLFKALEKITEQAQSWHDFHHGTEIECDEICEALPDCIAALELARKEPRRGRWYEAGDGPGLEYETGNTDPDLAWYAVGHIEESGRRTKQFKVRANGHGGPGFTIGTVYNLDQAKRMLMDFAGVTEIVE